MKPIFRELTRNENRKGQGLHPKRLIVMPLLSEIIAAN